MQLLIVGTSTDFFPANCIRLHAHVDPSCHVDVVRGFLSSLCVSAHDVRMHCNSSQALLKVIVPHSCRELLCNAQWVVNAGSARYPLQFRVEEAAQTTKPQDTPLVPLPDLRSP
eukprot:6400370-Pyramimonas_sp.AAC.1